jgi:regulator of RNase E activity RraA
MNDIAKQFAGIPTTSISDAMQGLGNMHSSIKPLKEEYAFAGRALTVTTPAGDNSAVLRALGIAQPGDVLVVDAKGDEARASAGDFVIGMSQTLGIAAWVVDGAIRDVVAVKKLNLPVFCRHTVIAASGKYGTGEVNVPISCGGVAVHPGDIIVGDADGVVVVPQHMAEEVLAKAKKKIAQDEEREAKISGNREAILAYLKGAVKG